MLAASLLAGALWTRFGPETTFVVGGVLASFALGVLLVMGSRLRARSRRTT
jgi:hypothetical protein